MINNIMQNLLLINNSEIDLNKWKKYKFKDIFFIYRGKNSKKPTNSGDIRFISSTSFNNGVSAYVKKEESNLIKNNVITVANNGSVGETFYQDKVFMASSDVSILENENFNEKICIFLIPIIKKIGDKYHYGSKWSLSKMKEDEIMLPSKLNTEKNEYEPDWNYMENYISELKKEIKIENLNKINNNIKIKKEQKILLDQWKEYTLSDIFVIEIAKSLDKNKITKNKNGVLYITRKTTNNGTLGRFDCISNKINKGNCLSLAMVGEYKGTVFYQKEDFLSSQNILMFKNNFLNKNIGIFIATILTNKFKVVSDYNGIKKSNVLLEKIKLPSKLNIKTNKYEPDWNYMENYISELEQEIYK